MDDKYNFQHPGSFEGHHGESYADIYDRVSAFFDGIRTEDFNRVIAVTHLGVLRNAKKHSTQCSDEDAVIFSLKPIQIYRAQEDGTDVETELIDCN